MKEFRIKMLKSFLLGLSFALGVGTITIYGVAISGSIVTWTSGQALTAADLNTTISSLVNTIGNIPDWTKIGSNAVYTAGNVGIGTSSPTQNLHISNGTQSIINVTGGSGVSHYGSNSTGAFLTTESAIPFQFFTNQNEQMRIDSLGNVGIGRQNPTKKLDVAGEIRASSLMLMVDQSTITYAARIFVSSTGSCGSPATYQQIGSIAGIGVLCWGEVVSYP
ncbi:MAG: hypothetical protein MH321_09430 [Leptospiraceae bacterium]|nr:hypothetical protein [Leptospiraceae bacterium]